MQVFIARCFTGQPVIGDRKLHALRHREGMGKNGRSYRRGYERPFCASYALLQVLS
jgi:hypothetical protein